MRTTLVQIVMPAHVNGANRLFGGRLMEWMDIAAAVEARRHAGNDVTLVAVDAIEFIAPAVLNDTVVLNAEVTWTGKTSLEVRTEAYVEPLHGQRKLINRAFLVFVAINAQGQPQPVIPFQPETPEQQAEWQAALSRRAYRLLRKQDRQNTADGAPDWTPPAHPMSEARSSMDDRNPDASTKERNPG